MHFNNQKFVEDLFDFYGVQPASRGGIVGYTEHFNAGKVVVSQHGQKILFRERHTQCCTGLVLQWAPKHQPVEDRENAAARSLDLL